MSFDHRTEEFYTAEFNLAEVTAFLPDNGKVITETATIQGAGSLMLRNHFGFDYPRLGGTEDPLERIPIYRKAMDTQPYTITAQIISGETCLYGLLEREAGTVKQADFYLSPARVSIRVVGGNVTLDLPEPGIRLIKDASSPEAADKLSAAVKIMYESETEQTQNGAAKCQDCDQILTHRMPHLAAFWDQIAPTRKQIGRKGGHTVLNYMARYGKPGD